MNKCEWCNKALETTSGRYCSGKCRQAAYRNRHEPQAVTNVTVTEPESVTAKPVNYGQDNCECKHCQQHRANKGSKLIHGPYKPASELGDNEINRVSLPGDADYTGCRYIPDDHDADPTAIPPDMALPRITPKEYVKLLKQGKGNIAMARAASH